MTKQTLNPGCYKYVKVNGEYRFFDVYIDHASQVNKEEKAQSAGTIAVFDEYWRFYSLYSSTLKIGADANDLVSIGEVIGKSFREN